MAMWQLSGHPCIHTESKGISSSFCQPSLPLCFFFVSFNLFILYIFEVNTNIKVDLVMSWIRYAGEMATAIRKRRIQEVGGDRLEGTPLFSSLFSHSPFSILILLPLSPYLLLTSFSRNLKWTPSFILFILD